jgi:ribonuclease-3
MPTSDPRNVPPFPFYAFHYPGLLKEALTHKSFVNENPSPDAKDNERLEFLGDAVLDMVITEYVFERLPGAKEGELSKIKSTIVSEATLAEIARKLNIGDYLFLGKGEESSRGRTKNSLLANTLEAVIAAIYLDGGLQEAKGFIHRWFIETIEGILVHPRNLDYKTDFQELCQRKYEVLPEYRLVRSFGPDHDKTFEIHLLVKEALFGVGIGKSKKEAEQKAAKEGLLRIREAGES